MEISSAVVTGGTGVIGTALIKRLVKGGIKVYAVCRHGSPHNVNIPSHELVTQIECDIGNLQELPRLIEANVDAFFHFAWTGTTGQNRMDMYLQNGNVKYALDSVKAAQALGCSVYIGAGSQAEYGPVLGIMKPDTPTQPISGYGMAKLCAGHMTRGMCKELGIRHIWVRILSVYGSHMPKSSLIMYVILCLMRGESPKLTDGEQKWDYLHSRDAAEALYLMVEKGRDGAVYVLGSGKTRPLKDFMMDIQQIVNKNIPLSLGELPYLPDQAMHLQADIESLTSDTGWFPKTNFSDGIRSMLSNVFMNEKDF